MAEGSFALAQAVERDYVHAMDDDSIEQFREQPKITTLYNALARQLQDVRTFLSQLMDDRFVSTAVGKQLDGVGDIAVLTRMEAGLLAGNPIPFDVMDDETYRKYLIFKILKNNCDCTYPDIIKALRMFWDKPLYYREEIDEPATMIFDTGVMIGDVDTSPLFTTPLLRAAGVNLKIYARTQKDIPSLGNVVIGSDQKIRISETTLPHWEPESYQFQSRAGIASGFFTIAVQPPVPNREPEHSFYSRAGIASGHGETSFDRLPRYEPELTFRERCRIGAVFRSESTGTLPRMEPGITFPFKLVLGAGDFRSATLDTMPRIEPEPHFDEPAEPEERRFSGRLDVASVFRSESVGELPRAEPGLAFSGDVGVASGANSGSESELPRWEPEFHFDAASKLAEKRGFSGRSDVAASSAEESGFSGCLNVASSFQSGSADDVPNVEPEFAFSGDIGITSGAESGSESELPRLDTEADVDGD